MAAIALRHLLGRRFAHEQHQFDLPLCEEFAQARKQRHAIVGQPTLDDSHTPSGFMRHDFSRSRHAQKYGKL
jgi:hypothetical protein